MLHFKIVTPERVLLDTEVDSVSLPTPLGEITVLQHHTPLVSNLAAGELHYKKTGDANFLAVSGGFVEVKQNGEVIVLADTAEFGHEIDETRAEEAKTRAKELMAGKYHDEKSLASASALLEKNLTRLKVVRKHRSRGQNVHTEQ